MKGWSSRLNQRHTEQMVRMPSELYKKQPRTGHQAELDPKKKKNKLLLSLAKSADKTVLTATSYENSNLYIEKIMSFSCARIIISALITKPVICIAAVFLFIFFGKTQLRERQMLFSK